MLIPFINFTGQAAEAIAFYETVFEVQNKKIVQYKDTPEDFKKRFKPETHNHIAHSAMTINGTLVWIADSWHEISAGERVTIGVPLATKEAVQTAYDKLKAGGTVLMEIEPTFYSPLFGVVKDKFGVVWQLIVMNSEVTFDKDFTNKKIVVTSKFYAPSAVIWDAFTNAQTLEKWWAPKPYKAVTKEMNFREGGRWLYYMLFPDGRKAWGFSGYKSIDPGKSFVASDAFSDENGNIDPKMPFSIWTNTFSEENGVTTVVNSISFDKEDGMRELLKTGFEDGYRTGLGQLQELL